MNAIHSCKNRGVILLFVMGMIFLISIVVVEYLNLATREIAKKSRFADEGEFRVEALNLLALSLGVVQEFIQLDSGVHSPIQGWGTPLTYAQYTLPDGWTANVRVYDESGKLALGGYTDPKVLSALFRALGFDAAIGSLLTDSLLDWMDTDQHARLSGAENDFYERQDIPYTVANQRIKSFNELIDVQGFREHFWDEKGQPNAAFEAFKQSTSFERTRGGVNINTASDPLRKALCEAYGMNEDIIKAKLDGPDGVRMTSDDDIIKNVRDLGLSQALPRNSIAFLVDFLRIKIVLQKGINTYRLTALCERKIVPKSDDPRTKKKARQNEAFPNILLIWGQ